VTVSAVPSGLALDTSVGGDGSNYFTTYGHSTISQYRSDGTVVVVAGTSTSGSTFKYYRSVVDRGFRINNLNDLQSKIFLTFY
jgi:hypothetical protein